MKKVILALLCAAVAVCAATVFVGCDKQEEPAGGSVGLEYIVNADGITCTVTGVGTCTDSDIVIPVKSPEGYLVTAIGESAFAFCYDIESVAIPYGVTNMGEGAFYQCGHENIYITDLEAWCKITGLYNLMGYGSTNKKLYLNNKLITDLIIPDGITTIGEFAFGLCGSIKSVTIPYGVTSIGDQAFYQCVSLSEVKIPNSVTEIGVASFFGCYNITGIKIPDSVKTIGDRAFWECGGLKNICINDLESWLKISGLGNLMFNTYCDKRIFLNDKEIFDIVIPSGTTTLSDYAFYGCGALTSITIPDSVTSIGNMAFEGCANLKYNEYDNGLYLGNSENPYVVLIKANDASTTLYRVNENTKIIYGRAFAGCGALTSVVIPDGVISIGNGAFESCKGLTSIVIPDSVTSIGYGAFYGCRELTSVTIGSGVTGIGYSAFGGCSRLIEIHYEGTVEQWKAIASENIGGYDTGNYTVYCTDGNMTEERG